LLQKHSDFFMDIGFSAQLEDDICAIADGKKKFLPVVQSFYDVLSQKLGDGINDNQPVGAKCSECKSGEILQRRSKSGNSFFACGNFPNCKAIFIKQDNVYVLKPEQKLRKIGMGCMVCKNGNVVEREGQYGTFLTCDLPECKARYRWTNGQLCVK
jgi:DNA topoisomerase-1